MSISQICEEISISPGNFTSYYARKVDLVDDHFAAAQAGLEGFQSTPGHAASTAQFARTFVDLLELAVDYRFPVLGGNDLIKSDLIPARRTRM